MNILKITVNGRQFFSSVTALPLHPVFWIRIRIVKWENELGTDTGSEKQKQKYKNIILFLKINHFFG